MQDILVRQSPTLNPGDRFVSPGKSYEYEVIGACCPLFDRDTLPYPCCNVGWMGKEPSWNRRGRRFIPDVATRQCENYSVKLIHFIERKPLVWSFTYRSMGDDLKRWWIDPTQREVITNTDGVWSIPLGNYQQLRELLEVV